MDDLARAEYPAMLAHLQPAQAVNVVGDRVKRINRINLEIADWLQERRRVEEQYVLGLRKLAQFRVPNAQTELGVFQSPWNRITEAAENIAVSHHQYAERIERDIENPLRVFQQRKDFTNMNTVSANLSTIAKDLEDARSQSDKLNKKGGKASTQKVDAAMARLESATQQWESQAPFIFETLQALDESRVNHLRDLLTQYQTHESDQAQRSQDSAVETLAQMLEISTEKEIQNFVQKTTAGKPKLQTRAPSTTRQSSVVGSQISGAGAAAMPPPPSTADSNNVTPPVSRPTTSQPTPTQPPAEDNVSEHNSVPSEPKPESKLRRLGTMFGGRRRQSVHGGFGQLTPQKTHSFGRSGRNLSPRASSTNLRDSSRLGALSEKPDEPMPERNAAPLTNTLSHEGTNGVGATENIMDSPVPTGAPALSGGMNGTRGIELSDVPPPPGPPPSQQPSSPNKDAEGYTIPAPMNDPISEAQREATGEDVDQLYKLNIQPKPIQEEDQEAQQAALSSVANTLMKGPAVRRAGTLRGRRDVRNTIYVPSPNVGEAPSSTEAALPGIPGSPPLSQSLSRPTAVQALASEASIAGTSDSQSVRSGHSLGNLVHVKHPEMTGPGLNTSIIETVSAVFENGEVKSATIAGEVAFVNNPSGSGETKDNEIIRINNFPNLERIGPNRIFVQNSSPDQNDQFSLDISHLSKMATAFSYRVFAEESDTLAQHAPLLLKPAWKPQGDKLGLLLQYQLNPASNFTSPVTLQNVVLVATYNGRASGAQTKPSGTHLKEKHLVYWRLGDITLTNDMQKIVCRVVGAEGTEPTPGHIEARWEHATTDPTAGSGITISRLQDGKGKGKEAVDDDPFADESLARASPAPEQNWVEVPLSRKLVSGKYEGR